MKKRGKVNSINRKGQMHFAWIFAIIVGAIILFLTFFFLSRQIFVQEQKQETETAHSLDILLGPFSYLGSITDASSQDILLFESKNLEFECEEIGLGYSVINVENKASNDIHDKYIFARNMETKNISVISKSFEMPFRIADLIYLVPGDIKHCFVNAPMRLENELNDLELNFEFQNNPSMCEQGSVKICFDVSGYCDVKVSDRSNGNYDYGEVRLGSDKMYFADDALLYGAIFSSQGLYNCNLKRLASRMDPLIAIYREKDHDLAVIGCQENYHTFLVELDTATLNLNVNNLNSILALYNAAQELDTLNSGATCALY